MIDFDEVAASDDGLDGEGLEWKKDWIEGDDEVMWASWSMAERLLR